MKTTFKKSFAVLTALLMLICMLPVGVFAEGDIPIDEEHFPDANFREYVLTASSFDSNGNVHKIDADSDGALSPEEIAAVMSIDIYYDMEIADLTGIEYFTALTYLDCSENQLTSLDVSNNTALTDLFCWGNQLTQLDVSNNTALTSLDCSSNQLTQLDVSNNTALEWLYCFGNQLTELDVSNNTALECLNCYDNQLTELDVSNNTALWTLYCGHNQLTSMNLSNNTYLEDWDEDEDYEKGFKCDNNKYRVTSDPFDLTELPGNFDVTKASNWQGGSVSGSILTFDEGSEKVTYTYDCGNGLSAEFKLILSDTVPGDYDCNGIVNVQDAILTLRAAMNLITPSEQSLLNADMDNNGILTVSDAITILRKAMGLI